MTISKYEPIWQFLKTHEQVQLQLTDANCSQEKFQKLIKQTRKSVYNRKTLDDDFCRQHPTARVEIDSYSYTNRTVTLVLLYLQPPFSILQLSEHYDEQSTGQIQTTSIKSAAKDAGYNPRLKLKKS